MKRQQELILHKSYFIRARVNEYILIHFLLDVKVKEME